MAKSESCAVTHREVKSHPLSVAEDILLCALMHAIGGELADARRTEAFCRVESQVHVVCDVIDGTDRAGQTREVAGEAVEMVVQREGMDVAVIDAQSARPRPRTSLVGSGGKGAQVEELIARDEIFRALVDVAPATCR